MPPRIVKPLDWEFVRTSTLTVAVADVPQEGYVVRLFSATAYFTLPFPLRPVLAEAALAPRPDGVATATLDAPDGPPDGHARCVMSVCDPTGLEVWSSGVNLAHSPVTTWRSGRPLSPDPVRYPLPLVGSRISHTPGEIQCDLLMLPDVQALCDEPPSAVIAATLLSTPRDHDGLRNISLPHCLGQEEPSFVTMLGYASWTTIVPYLVRIHDAEVSIPSGLVMFAAGLWSDSTLTAFFNDPALRQHPPLFRANDKVGYFGGAATEAALLAANGMRAFPGIPMVLSNIGYGNHAHWLLNSMLAAYLCRDMIAAGRICVLVPTWSDYIVASLAAVGVPRRAILVAAPGFQHLSDVLFPSTLSTHVNRSIPPEALEMFEAVRAHARRQPRAPGPRLVYLTRKGSNAQRKISNEDALIEALLARGFAIIAPHELTFDEEVACVSDADVVVGQLGAAMINIAFAPATAWIVELASQNYDSHDYWVMATTKGQTFVRILARAPTGDAVTLTDFSFEVPLDATLASIDRVCETAAQQRQTREG